MPKTINIILLGDSRVGKTTCLIKHLMHWELKAEIVSTPIIEEYEEKIEGKTIRIWDTTGRPRNNRIPYTYPLKIEPIALIKFDIIFLFYDITNHLSLKKFDEYAKSILKYAKSVQKNSHSSKHPFKIVLVGTKIDLATGVKAGNIDIEKTKKRIAKRIGIHPATISTIQVGKEAGDKYNPSNAFRQILLNTLVNPRVKKIASKKVDKRNVDKHSCQTLCFYIDYFLPRLFLWLFLGGFGALLGAVAGLIEICGMFKDGCLISQEVMSPERQVAVLQRDSIIGAGLGLIVGPVLVLLIYLVYSKLNAADASPREPLSNTALCTNICAGY